MVPWGAICPVLTGLTGLRYDAAIIGAGANGLGAAAHLGRAGLNVIVLERGAQAGGRLQTRQFRPGFFASPFMDSVPEIAPPLLERLDIALRPAGNIFNPADAALNEARVRAFDQAP